MSTPLFTGRGGLAAKGLAALASLTLLGALEAPAFAAPPTTSPGDPTGATAAPPTRGGALIGDEGGSLPFNKCKKMGRKAKFTVTLPRETELDDLINWMMSITCQKFVLDRKVRSSKVTILSPEPVTVAEAYAAFYAALELMGLTVEPSGQYFKIVETSEAKNRSLPLYGDGSSAPGSDRFVTQLIRVKHGNPKEISDLLNSLKSKNGAVDTVGNLIILTDKGTSVRRLLRLVDELDRPGNGEKIFFYQLQYASSTEVAEIIRDIFGQQGAAASSSGKGKKGSSAPAASGSRVLVDERTNTLIIVTSEAEYRMIRRLLEQLDVKLPGGGGRIHVKKLKNADADEVAQVLSNLATGAKAAADAKGSAKTGNKGAAAAASAELFSGDVKITPDKATRSLVIIASQADYQNLEQVIDDLDSERKQLYFEIYLMEVTIKRSITGGAGGHFGVPFDTAEGQALGLVSSAPNAAVSSLLVSPDALTGLGAAIIGPLVPNSGTLLGIGRDVPAFGMVIQALQTSEDVNVVSEPHMYAADNQEATIEVGRNVPTPGALSFNSGGGNSLVPLQSVERQDVTLRIKVKPYINDERTVTMDVEIEDRDIAGQDPVLGVTTTKRRLKLDKIVGRDDQPMVLGGLIRDREGENIQQVPGLGSIPLLGWLFKRKQKTKEKVNLLIVMIPHILESPDDVRRIHARRDRERLDFIERETNFKKREIPRNVNFRKKAGVLATIDLEARRVEMEEDLLRKAEDEMRLEIITGEIGLSPARGGVESDDSGGADPSPAPAAISRPARAGRAK